MIKRVFDEPGSPPYYVCTECKWAFFGLQEANKQHAKYCGKAVPVQPTFEKDDATQFYTNEVRTWQGLTDEEIWGAIARIGTSDSNINPYQILNDARAIEAALKKKNT